MRRRAGWWRLPSGARFHSPTRPHPRAVPVDADGHELGHLSTVGVRAVHADTVVKVHDALAGGDRAEANRLLAHAVHLGVEPVDLLLAFASDEVVQAAERGGAVRADVPVGDLPADAGEVSEGPSVGDRPAGEDKASVDGQAPKPTRRRKTTTSDGGEEGDGS